MRPATLARTIDTQQDGSIISRLVRENTGFVQFLFLSS